MLFLFEAFNFMMVIEVLLQEPRGMVAMHEGSQGWLSS